jgi:hypothetical protein
LVWFLSATLGGFFAFAFAFALAFAVAPSRRGGLVFWGFVLASVRRCLLRTRFGLFASALASALCLRASRVAPVRGGTYFSLPPQRKVGKRKRLTPPILVLA